MAETAGVNIGGKKYSYKTLAVVGGALLGAFVLLRNQGTGQAGYSSAEGTNQRISGIEEGVTKLVDDLYKYIDGMFQQQPVSGPISTTPSYWNAGGPSVSDWGLDVVAAQNFSSAGSNGNPVKQAAVKAASFDKPGKLEQAAVIPLATPKPGNVKTPSGSIASTPAQSVGLPPSISSSPSPSVKTPGGGIASAPQPTGVSGAKAGASSKQKSSPKPKTTISGSATIRQV